MKELAAHEALVHTLRHGGDRNCEHLRSPKAVRGNRGPMFLNHGQVVCQQCAAKVAPTKT